MKTDEKFFSFIVKTDFTQSSHRFDQCGIVMYLDSENWLKASVEYENESFAHLGSVVTNHGYSDWATTAISADVKTMWYRLSRREDDYCIECSRDGIAFSQMRVCHMWEGAGEISFGIYACSPEDSSFKAVFTDMQMTPLRVESPRRSAARPLRMTAIKSKAREPFRSRAVLLSVCFMQQLRTFPTSSF